MSDDSTELWKPVPFETYASHYSVSNLGRVRREISAPATHAGRILKIIEQKGYASVNLKIKHLHKRFLVHQLVALAFIGKPPGPIGAHLSDYQIDHINGNKLENHVGNLQWVTQRENKRLATINGQMASGDRNAARLHPEKMPRGASHWQAKLSTSEVASIRDLSSRGFSQRALASQFNTTQTTIRRIIH